MVAINRLRSSASRTPEEVCLLTYGLFFADKELAGNRARRSGRSVPMTRRRSRW